MKATLTVKENKELMRALKAMGPMTVLVGIPDSKDGRAATYPGGLTSNAAIGYLNEFGNPSTNLPPRPHLIPGVTDAASRIANLAEVAVRKQLAGNATAIRDSLDMFGLVAVAAVKKRIQSNIPPPLAPRTVMNRLYRMAGYAGANPRQRSAMRQKWANSKFTALIDTGAYINSITYVVRKRP